MSKIISNIMIVSILLLSSCDYLRTGSYPYAEYYTFETPRNDLISRINQFKKDNPNYKLITVMENGEKEEYSDDYTENFYHIYFYLEEEDMTLHCHINVNIQGSLTIIGFDAISRGVNFGRWKNINTSDLSRKENKKFKKIFETEILDKLGTWKHE